jgi:hypothetical protein
MTKNQFRGVVGGVTYTDRALFEQAAHDLGFRGPGKDRARSWKIGTPVAVVLNDGTRVGGQVWSMSSIRNYAWLALDTGAFVEVFMPRPEQVRDEDRNYVGKVAA